MTLYTRRGTFPYPAPADPTNPPQDIKNLADALAAAGVLFSQGTLATRPTTAAASGQVGTSSYVPSTAGRLYLATDTTPAALFYDRGGSWVQVNVNPLSGVMTTVGDLVVGGGSDGSPTRLPLTGTDGAVLTARPSGASPRVRWEAPPTAGAPVAASGATVPTRYVGGTTSGPPTSGSFAVGDFVVSATQGLWICTAAGTPGSWINAAGVPAFHMVAGSAPAIPSGPYTTITSFLAGSIDTHGGCTSSGFVIPRPGVWHFDFHVAYHPWGYGQRYGRLTRNGDPAGLRGYAFTGVSAWSHGAPGAAGYQGPAGGIVYPHRLAAGDVIALQTAQDSGSSIEIYGAGLSDVGTTLSGHWLHD